MKRWRDEREYFFLFLESKKRFLCVSVSVLLYEVVG